MKENVTREDWVIEAKREKLSLFAELDLLLKALEKFFIVENLPQSNTQFSTKNFIPELTAAKDVIIKVLSILESIIPENKKSAFWFKKFAENRLLSNRESEIYRASLHKQDTNEKSLFLLYESFTNLKSIVSDLMTTRSMQYISYRNIGQLISAEIRENVFFNPFRRGVDLEMDIIENAKISSIVKNIKDDKVKKPISILFLHLFRLMRCLRHIDRSTTQPLANLHVSVVILSLLRSEFAQFRSFADSLAEGVGDESLSMLLKALSYQFRMETRRVYSQELKDILQKKSSKQLRGKIENSHGILNNLIEQAILQLAQYWEPELKGDEVFMIFITKTEQSLKLREDLYVLSSLIINIVESANPKEKRAQILILMNYMDYFESFTFKLLRHDDYEGFLSILTDIRTAYNKKNVKAFLERIHNLNILLGATISQVENRHELKDKPLDVEKAKGVMRQYVSMTK
jgi:hypothetical protein